MTKPPDKRKLNPAVRQPLEETRQAAATRARAAEEAAHQAKLSAAAAAARARVKQIAGKPTRLTVAQDLGPVLDPWPAAGRWFPARRPKHWPAGAGLVERVVGVGASGYHDLLLAPSGYHIAARDWVDPLDLGPTVARLHQRIAAGLALFVVLSFDDKGLLEVLVIDNLLDDEGLPWEVVE